MSGGGSSSNKSSRLLNNSQQSESEQDPPENGSSEDAGTQSGHPGAGVNGGSSHQNGRGDTASEAKDGQTGFDFDQYDRDVESKEAEEAAEEREREREDGGSGSSRRFIDSGVKFLAVGDVSKIGRGKHTTTSVTLIRLIGGGCVADTPGFGLPTLDR